MFRGSIFHKKYIYQLLSYSYPSKAVPGKFEEFVGIVNATIYKTGSIFTGLGHGKLSYILKIGMLLASFTHSLPCGVTVIRTAKRLQTAKAMIMFEPPIYGADV